MSLEYMSATEIGRLVNNKELKALEILDFFRNRIEERNKRINAFVYTKFEEAEQKALEVEKRIMQGLQVGPFAGVPFGLKDFLPNKPGWTSSHGGVECLISTDTCYSEFCKAMEHAGGIAVGKTNAPAYGFRGVTDNRLYGPTSTPFNIRYNSGGSSGGSAGTEDPNGPDDVTAPVSGNKSVNIPRVLKQRVSKAPAETQYRVVFMLEEDCPVVNLVLKAIGDDGNKEQLKIVDYKIDRSKVTANAQHIAIKDIKAKTTYEVFLNLEYAERMQLELLLY